MKTRANKKNRNVGENFGNDNANQNINNNYNGDLNKNNAHQKKDTHNKKQSKPNFNVPESNRNVVQPTRKRKMGRYFDNNIANPNQPNPNQPYLNQTDPNQPYPHHSGHNPNIHKPTTNPNPNIHKATNHPKPTNNPKPTISPNHPNPKPTINPKPANHPKPNINPKPTNNTNPKPNINPNHPKPNNNPNSQPNNNSNHHTPNNTTNHPNPNNNPNQPSNDVFHQSTVNNYPPANKRQKVNPQVAINKYNKKQKFKKYMNKKTNTSNETVGFSELKVSVLEMIPCNVFKWLLYPVFPVDFRSTYWEKLPLFVDRNISSHYDELNVNTNRIDEILRENQIHFGKNIDITTYANGVRETHNPVGRALSHIVWDFFKNGCSIRFLNPQTYIESIYRLNELLQNQFNGFVGANLYITPPNSQGFAPHYDDIEAFVLQLQGTKYWKVYKPRTRNEELPRYSSPNFSVDEVGEPILECVLKPGDLLYFPRGYIHQASTRDDLSLHITLSAYQCTAYVDLLEKLLPQALAKAAKSDIEFRRGLPVDYSSFGGVAPDKVSYLGLAKNEALTAKKSVFRSTVETLVKKLVNHIDINSAIDSLVAKNLHDQLPPYFPEDTKNCMVFNNRTNLSSDGKRVNIVQLSMNTKVRLVNPSKCRLLKSDNKYLLYHSMNNSMEYHGNEEEFLEVPEDNVNAFKYLSTNFPNYVEVKSLPAAKDDDEAKWVFANSLWEIGLLRTTEPIKAINSGFTSSQTDDDGAVSNDDEVGREDDDDDNKEVVAEDSGDEEEEKDLESLVMTKGDDKEVKEGEINDKANLSQKGDCKSKTSSTITTGVPVTVSYCESSDTDDEDDDVMIIE